MHNCSSYYQGDARRVPIRNSCAQNLLGDITQKIVRDYSANVDCGITHSYIYYAIIEQ